MRFLHAADLHLGLRVTRFGAAVNSKVQEARLEALDRLVARARGERLDFVCIAGDLFDDNHVDVATSRRSLEVLESMRLPVYVIPGNHDPLTADSVFERPPWSLGAATYVKLLRKPEPLAIPGGMLFPCPLTSKNSFDDPTRWIPAREPGDSAIRIGLAHGSLRDRDNLPEDDHLIDRHVADAKGLDYLALGHWHSPSRHADRKGIDRTAYPGVHEPMRFHDNPGFATGWSAYSNTTQSDLFTDDGKGRALLVRIDTAGSPPRIDEVETGCLHWSDETRELQDEAQMSALIDELARRDSKENCLLRLHLRGTLSAQAMLRLDELDATLAGSHGGVLSRYLWAELDIDQLYAEPTDVELQDLAGDGVVRAVYERLKSEAHNGDPAAQQIARQAMQFLYRFAQEVRT